MFTVHVSVPGYADDIVASPTDQPEYCAKLRTARVEAEIRTDDGDNWDVTAPEDWQEVLELAALRWMPAASIATRTRSRA